MKYWRTPLDAERVHIPRGAVISHGEGGWAGKAAALAAAGVTVIENPARMGETVAAWFALRRAAGAAAPAKKTGGRKRGGA